MKDIFWTLCLWCTVSVWSLHVLLVGVTFSHSIKTCDLVRVGLTGSSANTAGSVLPKPTKIFLTHEGSSYRTEQCVMIYAIYELYEINHQFANSQFRLLWFLLSTIIGYLPFSFILKLLLFCCCLETWNANVPVSAALWFKNVLQTRNKIDTKSFRTFFIVHVKNGVHDLIFFIFLMGVIFFLENPVKYSMNSWGLYWGTLRHIIS